MICEGATMAIPPFGFLKIEAFACIMMIVAGIAVLLVVLTGSSDWILAFFWNQSPTAQIRPLWLVLQSFAVIGGGIGAWRSRSFTLAAIGVVSSLMRHTAVGHVSFFPGLLMFFLICARSGAFNIFLPRRRGPGLPPPGAWKGWG